jgi:hypothetical protein
MTGIIYYCDICTHRIPDAEHASGQARLGPHGKLICAACALKGGAAPETAARRVTPPNPAAHLPAAAAHSAPMRISKPSQKAAGKAAKAGISVEIAAVAILAAGLGIFTAGLLLHKPPAADVSVAAKKEEPPKKIETPAPRVPTPSPPAALTPTIPAPARPESRTTPSAPVVQRAPQVTPPAIVAAPEKKTEVQDFDPRAAYAAHLLDVAREFIKNNPEDVYAYREQLEKLRDTYRSTAPGKEAAQLLSELKMPAVDPALDPPLASETDWAKAIQVLPASDPGKDQLKGNWSKPNGMLRSDMSTWSQLALPCLLPAEYDIRVTFTRAEGEDCLLVNLAHKGRPFVFSIGGAGNMGCSLEDIASKKKYMLPVKLTRAGILTSKQRNQVIVQVREKIVRAFLNGQPIVGCVMDDATVVVPHADVTPPKPNQLGLLTWASVYEFHAVEVLEVKGKLEFMR